MSSLDRLTIAELTELRGRVKDPDTLALLDERIAEAERNAPVGFGDLARAVGQGAWSMGDEVEAGLRTGFGFAGDYDATKAQINSEIAQAYDSNPIAMNAVEFGSGFLIPGGNIAKGVKLAGKGWDGLKSADTLTGAAKAGAFNGAVNGAIDGFGASTLSEDGVIGTGLNMAQGAGIGTGFGTLLGAGLPALTRGLSGFERSRGHIAAGCCGNGPNARGNKRKAGRAWPRGNACGCLPSAKANGARLCWYRWRYRFCWRFSREKCSGTGSSCRRSY